MDDYSIKIRQEKENAKCTSKRILFAKGVRDRLLKKIEDNIRVEVVDGEVSSIDKDLKSIREAVAESAVELYLYDVKVTKERMELASKQVVDDLGRMLKTDIKDVTNLELKEIMDREIKGMNYSDRLWKHKEKLANEVYNIVKDKVTLDNVDLGAVSKDIAKRYDVDLYSATRLLNQEVSKVESEVKLIKYKESPMIQDLEFITMEDEFVTEEICRPLHGKVYDKNDPNLPVPPLHVGCRSMLRPRFKGMDKYKFN